MCIRDRHILIYQHQTVTAFPGTDADCRDRQLLTDAVSYTHLDVYKRQVKRQMAGRDHNGSFTRSACPYSFKNRRHEHGRCRRQTSIKHLDAFFAETLQQSF